MLASDTGAQKEDPMNIRYQSLLLLTGLFLASPIWAHPPPDAGLSPAGAMHGPGPDAMHGPGPDPQGAMMWHLMHAMQQLDLSEEQKDAIHQLMEHGKEEMNANRQASMETLRDLHELLQADELDEGALSQLAQRSGELAKERVLLTGRHLHAILAELDDSQREQLRAMGEELRERHHHHERRHVEDDA